MAPWHHRAVTAFDLVLRGGTVDRRHRGGGAAGRRRRRSATGSWRSATCRRRPTRGRGRDRLRRARRRARVHRSARSFGRLASSSTARSPATSTRASRRSCRGTAATRSRPITDARPRARRAVLRPEPASTPRWATFGEYLDVVGRAAARAERRVPRRAGDDPRVGARRRRARRRPPASSRRWSAEVEAALEAGAFGLSSGLIYAPGMHARTGELDALVGGDGSARWPVRDPHAQRGGRAVRGARRGDRHGPGRRVRALACRCRTSSAARGRVWGRAGEAVGVSRRPVPRASTSPPTSIPTRPPTRAWRRSCRRRCLALVSRNASRPCATATPATRIGPRCGRATRAGRT